MNSALAELDGLPCMSLWEPWATLLVAGLKTVETRAWSTNHRGPLLIHAAKRWTPEQGLVAADPLFFRPALQSLGIHFDANEESAKSAWGLPLGAIIGRVEVVDCLPTEEVREGIGPAKIVAGEGWRFLDIGMRERAFGDYSAGRFAWVTTTPEILEPIPYAGHQGIFRVRGGGSVSHLPPPCTCGQCNACAMFDAMVNGPKPLPSKQQPQGVRRYRTTQNPPPGRSPQRPKPAPCSME